MSGRIQNGFTDDMPEAFISEPRQPMTDLISELKALKEKATPGPVTAVSIGYHREPRLVDSTEKLLAIFGNAEDTEVAFAEWEANAELVAALVNHLPTILAKLEEGERMREAINSPCTEDFMKAVPLEAVHQVERWGADHDAGKSPLDWFWLIGYLAQKAVVSAQKGDQEKYRHHVITTGAALLNWFKQLVGEDSRMRPGIEARTALEPTHDHT